MGRRADSAVAPLDRARRALAVLIIAALPAACGPDGADSSEGERRSIPQPDAVGMQPRVRSALDDARARVIADPTSAAAWGVYGEICDAHELYPSAVTCYRAAWELDPGSFRWAYLLAIVLEYVGGEPEEVVRGFEIAADIDAGYAPVHYRFGDALARLGRHEEACASYRRALEIDPRLAMAARGLGQMLVVLGRPEEAIPHLERAALAAPGDRPTIAALARALAMSGDRERAEQLSESLPRLGNSMALPDSIRAAVLDRGISAEKCKARAMTRMAAGDFAGAADELRIVIESYPVDPEAHERLGMCLGRAGRFDEAAVSFEEAIRLDESRIGARVELAGILLQRRDLEPAAIHLRRVIELDPAHGPAFARLGAVYAIAGQADPAIACFERAEALSAANAPMHRNWGALLMNRGDRDGAIAHYRRAIEIDPRYPGAYFALGQAFESAGRRAEAIEHYRVAASLRPGGPAAQRLRALGAQP